MLCCNAGCSIDIETPADLGRLYLINFVSFITKTFDRKIVVTFLSISYTFTESILTFFQRHQATIASSEYETTSKTFKKDSKIHATKQREFNHDVLKY